MTKDMASCSTMSVESAAQRLGIGIATAYRGIRNGEIPSIRIGKRILVPCPALETLLSEGRPQERGPGGHLG